MQRNPTPPFIKIKQVSYRMYTYTRLDRNDELARIKNVRGDTVRYRYKVRHNRIINNKVMNRGILKRME